MSRFFSKRYASLTPYTPGEQPQDRKYIKLNTNESPFPPSARAIAAAAEEAGRLQLYSDPECLRLRQALAERYAVKPEQVIVTNGSDEALNFAFMAFCDEEHPAVFADITYGFYPVYAEINHVPYREIPLREDLTIAPEDFYDAKGTIVLANPNAQTGVALPRTAVEEIIRRNAENIVIVDEAYVDFGGESCVELTEKYDNLLVVQTFSKSRSMAGARLGFAIGNEALITDLNTIRYSNNPYNVNRMTLAAGVGILADRTYTEANCRTIVENRAFTEQALQELGFMMPPSSANFLLARHAAVGGETLYRKLKERGILVRHFSKERICESIRITIGTREQMEALVANIREILEETE